MITLEGETTFVLNSFLRGRHPMTVYVAGTFDGGTVRLQARPLDDGEVDDNLPFVTLGEDAEFTEDGYSNFELYGNHQLRLESTGSANIDVKVILAGNIFYT